MSKWNPEQGTKILVRANHLQDWVEREFICYDKEMKRYICRVGVGNTEYSTWKYAKAIKGSFTNKEKWHEIFLSKRSFPNKVFNSIKIAEILDELNVSADDAFKNLQGD